ncbi:20407_t:CDS:2, partial [Racocetra persica]
MLDESSLTSLNSLDYGVRRGQIETKEKLLTDLKQRKALLPTEGQEEINQEIKEQEELLEELKKQEQRERLIWESQETIREDKEFFTQLLEILEKVVKKLEEQEQLEVELQE